MVKRQLSLIRPSGVALPLILRKKYNDDLAKQAQDAGVTVDETKKLPLHPNTNDSHVFTADELEQKMTQASSVMADIQKQLYRGEEVYVDETHAHGNLFRGWDTFIDLRDLTEPTGGSRRVPADNRWFSGSCGSAIGIHHQQRPQSRMAMSATPTPRSAAPTPVTVSVVESSSPTKTVTAAATTTTTLRITTPPPSTTREESNISFEFGADGSTTPLRRNSSRKRSQGEAS